MRSPEVVVPWAWLREPGLWTTRRTGVPPEGAPARLERLHLDDPPTGNLEISWFQLPRRLAQGLALRSTPPAAWPTGLAVGEGAAGASLHAHLAAAKASTPPPLPRTVPRRDYTKV